MGDGRGRLADIVQGRRLWSQRARGFAAHLVSYAPGCEMPPHSHATGNITVILAGRFEEEVEGHGHLGEPLDVVVKPAGAVHATRTTDAETRSLVLEVEGALEDELRRCYGLFDECRWFHGPCRLVPSILALCRALRSGGIPPGDGIMEWFARIAEAAAEPRAAMKRCPAEAAAEPRAAMKRCPGFHVRRAVEIMRRERAISTAALAERLGLHPVYLARLVRGHLGSSPRQVRQGLRLGAAMDGIVRTRRSLARVAVEAGFADQSHLARHTKRRAGMPPAVLRRLVSVGVADAPTPDRGRELRLHSSKSRPEQTPE